MKICYKPDVRGIIDVYYLSKLNNRVVSHIEITPKEQTELTDYVNNSKDELVSAVYGIRGFVNGIIPINIREVQDET